MVLVALPFLVVTFPPITDLPQQTAQVRLFLDAVTNPDSPYRVQWTTPNGLAWAPFGLAWVVLPPVAAGRVGMLLLALLWVGAVGALARWRRRSAAAAVLAAVFVFHHALYWGFAGFVAGFPIFALWLTVTGRDPGDRSAAVDMALHLGGALLLYFTHALWFAAGLLWLGIFALASRAWRRPGPWLGRSLAVLPVGVLALVWFVGVQETPFSTPPLWRHLPWERLAPERLLEASLGGLRGPLEAIVFALVLGWIALALGAAWRSGRLGRSTDRRLLGVALFFFALYLVLPDKYTNTILFAQRWLPPALACLVLAVPPLPVRPVLRRVLALGILAAFCLGTATVWMEVEARELAGLEKALAALPAEPPPKVLGLAFDRESPRLDGVPFLQTFAWAQVLRGGELNFSFALFPSSLVVYDPVPARPWTEGLEWYPDRVRREDFPYFTHVLMGASDDDVHRFLAGAPELEPVTSRGVWRLYRVREAGVTGRTRSTGPPGTTGPG